MNWEIWSSGNEQWTACVPPDVVEYLYTKTVAGRPHNIHRNELGQFFRCEVPDETEEES
jgi:hypothetical protein